MKILFAQKIPLIRLILLQVYSVCCLKTSEFVLSFNGFEKFENLNSFEIFENICMVLKQKIVGVSNSNFSKPLKNNTNSENSNPQSRLNALKI